MDAHLVGLIAMATFFTLLFLGREELEWRGIAIWVAIWAAVFFIFRIFQFPPPVFWMIEAVFNIILILVIFGGDIKIS